MSEQVNHYVTEVILALLALLAVLAKGWLNSLKKKAEAYFEARTTTEQRQILALLGKEAFSFAETVYKELKGPEKLAEAVKYLLDKAEAAGIKVTVEEARAVVEAAWLEDKRKEMPVIEVGELKTGGTE
ncbi:MAG TPA: phage holin, LLH family [Bacillota bacterium]|nr:phage holin, LLH family [Bacillota bacterium]